MRAPDVLAHRLRALRERPTEYLTPVVVVAAWVVLVAGEAAPGVIAVVLMSLAAVLPWLITLVRDRAIRRRGAGHAGDAKVVRDADGAKGVGFLDRPAEIGTSIATLGAGVLFLLLGTNKVAIASTLVLTVATPWLISTMASTARAAKTRDAPSHSYSALDNGGAVESELRTLEEVVPNREDVVDVIQANHEVAGVIAVTSDGVLFIAERRFTKRLEWFSYDELTSVRSEAGLFFGKLVLGRADGAITLTRVAPKVKVGYVACLIRERIRGARKQ
ncbi:MAG TPA: hypothetical protein VHJ34_03660 [Actinomycetota bacterium]|nr:hypothetical protein [Actinomycetota bacterium]